MSKTVKEILEQKKKQTLGNLSIIFACLSLFIFPPIFGIAGFVIGLVGLSKKEGPNSIVGFVLSCIFPWIGMAISFLLVAFIL